MCNRLTPVVYFVVSYPRRNFIIVSSWRRTLCRISCSEMVKFTGGSRLGNMHALAHGSIASFRLIGMKYKWLLPWWYWKIIGPHLYPVAETLKNIFNGKKMYCLLLCFSTFLIAILTLILGKLSSTQTNRKSWHQKKMKRAATFLLRDRTCRLPDYQLLCCCWIFLAISNQLGTTSFFKAWVANALGFVHNLVVLCLDRHALPNHTIDRAIIIVYKY